MNSPRYRWLGREESGIYLDDKIVHRINEQLAEITDLYTNVRYGETIPSKEQVANTNGLWKTLRTLIRGLRGD